MTIRLMVSVKFLDDFAEKEYDYLLLPEHESVKEKDFIVVPTKANNRPTMAIVTGFKPESKKSPSIPYKPTMSLVNNDAYFEYLANKAI